MGYIGDSPHALLHMRQRGIAVEELQQEPETDQEDGWNRDDGEEDEYEDDGSHPRKREQHQIRGQHTGNRATSSQARHRRIWINEDLRQTGNDAAENIKQQEKQMPHSIFYIVTKDKEKKHVARNVQDACMQKH